jgi:two-component system cell cycle response regulator DivK
MLLDHKRIFIVEDNLQNRIIFQLTLSRHGADLSFEPWGSRTLLHLQALSKIDLIILDLMLANGISGFDIFDQIRARPELDRVPVIAVSAIDPSFAIPKARKQGFSGFIAKPIDQDIFPRQLAAVLDGEKVWYAGESVIF